MARRVAYILPIILGSILALMLITPAAAEPAHIEGAGPAPTATLPLCNYEDGSGQALCYWDAQELGNGEGTSLISGDCAPDYIGGEHTSKLCIALFNKGQDGIDHVAECVGINNVMTDKDKEAEGFSLEECFKSFE